MVNIKGVRPGNLIIHKEMGVCLVVNVIKNMRNLDKSIIQACDSDDSIYEGPCEDWYNLWVDITTLPKFAKDVKDKQDQFNDIDNKEIPE